MRQLPDFWSTLRGVIVRPCQTFLDLNSDPYGLRKAFAVFLFVGIGYTAVLGMFIASDYPAAEPSALALTVEEQYAVQIWYQVPLFLLNLGKFEIHLNPSYRPAHQARISHFNSQ